MTKFFKPSSWVVILLAGSAMVTVTLGIRQVFGLFVLPVSNELGGGLQFFSLTIAFQNLVWGISSPFFGAVADRYGAWGLPHVAQYFMRLAYYPWHCM